MGDVQVVEFLERSMLDQLAVERVAGALDDAFESAVTPKLVIDFHKVTNISSAMLGVLINLNKKAREAKGEVRLACVSRDVRKVFKITRLDKLIKIYDSPDRALLSF